MYPDNKYPKIQFETGETAWLRYDGEDYLVIIAVDLTTVTIRKSLPITNYKILSQPNDR